MCYGSRRLRAQASSRTRSASGSAAGVNFADSLMVGGTYQVKPPFPFTPGLEAAGEIVETRSTVDGLQTGHRVQAVLRNGGGYAEEIVLAAAAVVPIPDASSVNTGQRRVAG